MEGAREIRKGFICSICNGFLRDSYNLPCGHTFCLECINDALADKNSCPTCMNPAWQKDILKTALADSAVQEWVTHCEAKFLALVARQEEQGDDEDTETDCAMSDESSEDDDEHGGTDVEKKEGEKEQEEEEEKKQAPSMPVSAAASQQRPAAPQAPKDEEMASAARARVPVSVGEGASGLSAGQGAAGAISTHGNQSNGAAGGEGGGAGTGASSLSDAKPATVDDRRSAVGGQEKENFAAPGARPPSAAAAASSADDPPAAAPSPRVVGVRRAAARGSSPSSSSDRKKVPRVRFQASPLRACGPAGDPCIEGVFGETAEASSQRNPLPPANAKKAGGASSSSSSSSSLVEGTRNARGAAADVEDLTRERETPEAPRIAGGVGNSSAASSPGIPAAVELERRGYTPPRRTLEMAREDAASTPPRSLPPRARRKGAAAVRDQEEASGFALALPDTCDIVDADPTPPNSPIATTNAMLLTPPAFQVGHAGSAGAPVPAVPVAAGCGMDAASATARPTDSSGGEGNRELDGVDGGTLAAASVAEDCERGGRRRLSPQSRVAEELPRGPPNPTSKGDASSSPAADGEGVPAEKCTGVGGNPLVGRRQDTDVEGSPANGEVRDNSSRLPPARRAAGDADHDDSTGCPAEGADGSRSEEEVSDSESVPLLGDDERRQGEIGQHQQHGPTTSVTPSRAVPSSRLVSADGGAAGSSDGPEELTQPPFGGGGGEAAEDEGEETCDEDGGEFGAARRSPGGGEPSAPGDELERPGPAEGVGSPSSPSLIHPGFPTGDDVAEREAMHSTAAAGDAAGMPSAKEQPAVNLARPASPTLTAPPPANTVEQHEERGAPAAQTHGTKPVVAMPTGSSPPRSGSLRGQSQASTAPTQGFSLQDERQTAEGVGGLEGDECGNGRGGLRVAETVPQKLGPGGGDVREEDKVEAPRGIGGDAAVPETAAESVLLAEKRKQNTAESFAGDVGAEDDPVVPETLVQSPTVAEVPEGRGGKSSVDGVEGLSPSAVQAAVAESQEQGRKGDEGAAAFDEEETGLQRVGGEEARDFSGGPARPADGSQRREDGHEEMAGRRVPETAAQNVTSQEVQTLSTQEVPETAAQSITTQQIQTLSTQEVPETARAWGSTAECGDSSAQLERPASGIVMASSSCPQSEVVETPPLRDGATTQSTAGCAGGAGGDDEAKGKPEQSAASARRSSSLSPSSSSALPAEAVGQGPAESDPGAAAREQAGALCLETPDGASAGSLRADAGGLLGAADSVEHQESATSPGGSRKRSTDSATLSPSRTSSVPGSAGKRLRMTPPPPSPPSPPVDGEHRPVRPGAATGDEEASPNGLADCGARQEAAGGEQGPSMALRGGSGSGGESDGESELPETDHDLAAVQDAWHAEGSYEYGDDGGYPGDDADEPEESRPPSPPPPKSKAIFNPYAPRAHLDLHADGDDSCAAGAAGSAKLLPPGGEASEGRGGPGGAAGATAAQGRSSRPALPRPSKSTMGFGAPSAGVARAASSLGHSALAARLKEKHFRQSSNSILGAGRGHGGTAGTTATKTSADKTGSWSTYDMGPDTQEVVEVQARLASKRAGKNPRGGGAMESSPLDSIDLDDDLDDDDDYRAKQGTSSRGRGQAGRAQSQASAEKKKRKRSAAAAGKRKAPGRSSNRDESRRHRPVVVLLGCSPKELRRAQQLCKKLRLRQPQTELVSGATHVVVGSRQTRARSGSGSGSSNDLGGGTGSGLPLDKGKERGGTGRRELVKHEVKGYREAVMLGLWVLDFSWVEACLAAEAEAEEASDRDKRDDDGVLPLTAPPRAFELVGCSKGHEGCEPRRGRYKRGSGVPGVFHGIEFVPVAVETAAGSRPSSPSPSRLALEILRSETERLVKLGGGVFASASKRPSRVEVGYLDNPFDFDDEEEAGGVDAGGTAHGRGGGAAAAKGKRVVVLALPDCLDEHGVSQSLAKAATRRRQELGADAAVDRAWVLRSVNKGSPISFGDYDLRRNARLHGGGGSSKRPAAPKSRLSIPQGSSSRCEVFLDMEDEGGRGTISAEAVRAQREQTARILQKAEEVVEAPIRQKLPPLDPDGPGEDGFDFTRRGSKKAPVKANVTTYTAENKAQRDLIDALHKGGYLDLDGCGDEDDMDRIDKEKRLGEYWYDYVYDGFFMKRSENAIPEATRRGCPVDILRAEHESHASIQTDRSRNCVKKLPGEYSVWKAGRDADDAVELL